VLCKSNPLSCCPSILPDSTLTLRLLFSSRLPFGHRSHLPHCLHAPTLHATSTCLLIDRGLPPFLPPPLNRDGRLSIWLDTLCPPHALRVPSAPLRNTPILLPPIRNPCLYLDLLECLFKIRNTPLSVLFISRIRSTLLDRNLLHFLQYRCGANPSSAPSCSYSCLNPFVYLYPRAYLPCHPMLALQMLHRLWTYRLFAFHATQHPIRRIQMDQMPRIFWHGFGFSGLLTAYNEYSCVDGASNPGLSVAVLYWTSNNNTLLVLRPTVHLLRMACYLMRCQCLRPICLSPCHTNQHPICFVHLTHPVRPLGLRLAVAYDKYAVWTRSIHIALRVWLWWLPHSWRARIPHPAPSDPYRCCNMSIVTALGHEMHAL
jgi:hypothetical protein